MLKAVLPALVASALLAGFAFWVYFRRELPIAGRGVLAALRAGALLLVVLLLLDPTLPGTAGGGGTWVILDATRSMTAGGDGGGDTPWSRALDRARTLEAGGATVVVLGDEPAGTDGSTRLDSLSPEGDSTRLAPALRRAAEAGARQVTLLSDLRLDDAVAVRAEGARLGLALEVVDVGGTVRSAGIARLDAPSDARAGAVVEVATEVFATEGAAGDSATLVLVHDGQEAARWPLVLPGPGATLRFVHEARLPDRSGPVHWQARVRLAGDAFPDDDVRTRVTEVDPASGIVALVALAPDWEPRFLAPVLATVTGLPVRGWLRVGPDRFLPMEGGEVVGGDVLRPILEDARMVVLQGRGAGAPDWVDAAARSARRVVTLAADEAGAAAAGVGASPPRPGEWYLAPPPPSPLAGILAGEPVAQLPPLTRVLVAAEGSQGVPALMVEGPGGAAVPALVLLDQTERREAVALATGFWRWAFRAGEPRDAYRRLWSGVAGWLLELEAGRSLAGVAPQAPVVPAGRPVAWRAPAAAGGRLEVTFSQEDSVLRVDTLDVAEDGTARQPSLGAGRLAWEARVLAPDSVAAGGRRWTGTLEAEAWTGELLPPRAELRFEAGESRAGEAAVPGLPLRTRPWPWLLLLTLLSLEWFGRRRRGLR